jgi:RNA polymerase sigma-70 factor (ECF subfamily)
MSYQQEELHLKKLFSWYEDYFSALYNYGCKINNDKELVKDCIQDVFIYLRVNPQLIADIRNPKTYLYTALRHKILQEIKKQTNINAYKFGLEHSEKEMPFEATLVVEEVFQEFKNQLKKSFNKLTPRQKEAIFLKFYVELSYPEIAQTMQLADVKSARNLIYKALQELKGDFKLNGIDLSLSTILLLLSSQSAMWALA